MAAGGVDTTRPFYFQTNEVPALTDWIRSHHHHHGEINDDYQLAEELTRNPNEYQPGAIELDRGDNLLNLAIVYRYITEQPGAIPGADPKIVANEITREINVFYEKFAGRDNEAARAKWHILDCSKRAMAWIQTYYLMDGTDVWTDEIAGRMNAMLGLQGDFIYDNIDNDNVPNHRTSAYMGLYVLGETTNFTDYNVTPTIGANQRASSSSDWLRVAIQRLKGEVLTPGNDTLDHYRADAGQVEQSPGYASTDLTALERVAFLEEANDPDPNHAQIFNTQGREYLKNAVDALYQTVDPSGYFISSGDTDRDWAMGKFHLPAVFLRTNRWSRNNPNIDALLIAWRDRNDGFLTYDNGSYPTPENHGGDRDDRMLPNSGYAFLHNGGGTQQLTLDVGPYGSAAGPQRDRGDDTNASGHGQFDLLNIELDAYGQALIVDPGYGYKDVRYKEWTSSHNTIAVIDDGRYVNNGAVGFLDDDARFNDTAANSYFGGQFLSPDETRKRGLGGGEQAQGAHTGFDDVNSTRAYRTVWTNDNDGDADAMYLVADWTKSNDSTTVEVGFNLPETARAFGDGYISGTDGGGVYVESLCIPSQLKDTFAPRRQVAMDRRVGPLQRVRMTDTSEQTVFVTMLVPYSGSEPGTLPTVTINRIDRKTGEIAVRITEGGRTHIVKLERYNAKLHDTARADEANPFTPIELPESSRPPRGPQGSSGEPPESEGGSNVAPSAAANKFLELRTFVPSMWVSFRLASHCPFWSDTQVDGNGEATGDLA